MLKICFIRGCRIIFMLALLAVATVLVAFVIAPNINFMKVVVEHELKAALDTQKVQLEKVSMVWNEGPVIDMGGVQIDADAFSIHHTKLSLTYTLSQLFHADFSPSVALQGGELQFDFDAVTAEGEASPLRMSILLQDAQVSYIYEGEKHTFENVYAELKTDTSHFSLLADELQLSATLADDAIPNKIHAIISDISVLPSSIQKYIQGNAVLKLDIQRQEDLIWAWEVEGASTQGLIAIKDAHVDIPFTTIDAKGTVQLSRDKKSQEFKLVTFSAPQVYWKDKENFGDFSLHWADSNLHIEAADGSVSMPMLWSWLWLLGDESWHDWLNSMKEGRISDVRASLDLNWSNPLTAVPTYQNLMDMKYHVVAKGEHIDIALGLGGDFLYQLEGKVLVDETHLEADVNNAILKDGIATGTGTYRIDWDTLLMTIKATGLGDVGRLHAWLDAGSAEDLNWGKSPAAAIIDMEWDAHKSEPNKTVVTLKPTGEPWLMNYKGIPIKALQGDAVWDFSRGLDIKHMQVELPWLSGDFSMFLDKEKNWGVSTILFDGLAPLKSLTDNFVLPITNPTGTTTVHAVYAGKKWDGWLDLSANDWDNFAGYDKEGIESLVIPFSGISKTDDLLPIQITHLHSKHHDFSFDASLLIKDTDLDFTFKHVDTSAFQGDFRLFMPLDATLAWGLEVDSVFMDKPVLTSYLQARGGSEVFTRPWTVEGHFDWIEWEKSYAQNVKVHFSSDKQSVGDVSAKYLISGDVNLQNVTASFTLNGQGNYNLRLLEAYGAGQKLQASGSVQVLKNGALKWQGLALMSGEFGTLMEQAELDKLFKEGEMSAVFLGHGEFKDGEPWWRKMKGSFKLKVNDGRIMEGGTLTHLLAAISLVDLPKYLIFDRGDVVGEGLKYDKLQVEGLFDENLLNIDKLAFLSSALDAGGKGEVDLAKGNLDIILVARPWQNIEVFVSKIPLLGSILTGKDASILRKVYRIHGPASEALVDEVDPESVGLPSNGYIEDLFTPSKWFEPRKKVEGKVK